MNTLAYCIYLFLTYLITVNVGLRFYRQGWIYILNLLQGDEVRTAAISRILLTGYYLLNLGYAALMINSWRTVVSVSDLVASIGTMTGRIVLTLGIIHFINMSVIYWISRHRKQLFHHKN